MVSYRHVVTQTPGFGLGKHEYTPITLPRRSDAPLSTIGDATSDDSASDLLGVPYAVTLGITPGQRGSAKAGRHSDTRCDPSAQVRGQTSTRSSAQVVNRVQETLQSIQRVRRRRR